MQSGTRREENDPRERWLILGGDREHFPGEMEPGRGPQASEGVHQTRGRDSRERTSGGIKTGRERRKRGGEKGFQNLTPLIRNPRDNK